MNKRKPWTRVTRDVLLDAPLPIATDTYTVISHSFCINTIKKLLSVKGFKVVNEIYSATDGAQIATGMFHINHGTDPELGMLFAFANSYNKKVKFSCSVGAYVKVNETSILTEGGSAWIRKHTGNADELAEEVVKQQVEDAVGYFDQLLKDKEAMKRIRLNQTQYSELLGRLYLDVQILAIGQVSHVRAEYHKPSFTYDADTNSLWTLYNHILLALAKSHPKTWMDQQKLVHLHISTVFDLTQFDEFKDDTVMEGEDGPYVEQLTTSPGEEQAPFEGDTDLKEVPSEELEEVIEEVVNEDVPLETEVFTEEVNAGPEAPAEDDEEMEILTDEDIAEYEDLEEVIDAPMPEEAEAEEEIPFVTDEEEDAVMESMLKPVDIEAVKEIEEMEGAPAETRSMTVEVAVEKFGHMLTEEELKQIQDGSLTQELYAKLKGFAVAEEVVTDQVEKVIKEEYVKTATNGETALPLTEERLAELNQEIDAGAEGPVIMQPVLPVDPSKVEATEEVSEEVSEEVDYMEREVDDFFMTKEDLNGLYEGELKIGLVITLGDEDCEVTHIGEDDGETVVGLCPLSDIAEAVEPDGELEEEVHVAEDEPISEDFPEPQAEQIDMNFEIGDAQEAVPSESMLSTKSQSLESVTDVNDAEQEQIDKALEIMANKVELTPEEKATQEAILSEIYELYGEKYNFTYKLSGSQYTITLETEETFVLEKSYVESLMQKV
jgi:hypothetical protein